MTKICH